MAGARRSLERTSLWGLLLIMGNLPGKPAQNSKLDHVSTRHPTETKRIFHAVPSAGNSRQITPYQREQGDISENSRLWLKHFTLNIRS